DSRVPHLDGDSAVKGRLSFQTRLWGLFFLLQLVFWLTWAALTFSTLARIAQETGSQTLGTEITRALTAARALEASTPGVAASPAWPELTHALSNQWREFEGRRLAAGDGFVRTAREVLSAALVELALSALLVFLGARGLARPLKLLHAALEKARDGNRTVRLPSLAGRELSVVAEEFNRLIDSLEDRERRLQEQGNLLGWQETARFLSHQIKSPLTAIRLAAGNLRDLGALTHPLAERNVAILEDETLRLQRLLARLGELTGFGAPLREAFDLKELWVAVAAQAGAALVWDAPPKFTVVGDRVLMEHLLTNLLQNSRDAAGNRAWVPTIACRSRTLVYTDGLGALTPGVLEKLFQPPFTTKQGGTGLGLTFCRKILTLHGGNLSAFATLAGGLGLILDFPEEPHG
ncbi:MAG: HAMP domain-containing sensor histidine kinase, partial [Rhodospirillaceae bacterium]